MRYWTIQPLSVWQTIQEQGFCLVDPALSGTNGWTPPCYLWLVEQLKRRIPSYQGNLPWWLYCGKPDLRWVRWTRPAGEWEVRLELELPAERVEEFMIRDWHVVYCQAWLCRHQPVDRWHEFTERRGWEDLQVYPAPYEELLERSWQRLFEPQRRAGHSRYRLEAVVERLQLSDVIRAQPFLGSR